ncbi:MAG TPA: hypothetical protein VNZ52_14495 [Candidatus Thermoplasmatota archaeon]|nr:hypothetical protein [Candidatus Thermoplasmatota archaeon]
MSRTLRFHAFAVLALATGLVLAGCTTESGGPANSASECGPAGAVKAWQGTVSLALDASAGDPSGESVRLKRAWTLSGKADAPTSSGTFFITPTGTVTVEDTASGPASDESLRLVEAPVKTGSIAFSFDKNGILGPKCAYGFTITVEIDKTGNASLQKAHTGIVITPRIAAPSEAELKGSVQLPLKIGGVGLQNPGYDPKGPLADDYKELAGTELGAATLTWDLKPA